MAYNRDVLVVTYGGMPDLEFQVPDDLAERLRAAEAAQEEFNEWRKSLIASFRVDGEASTRERFGGMPRGTALKQG